jgi:hypothetical protein
MNNFIVGQVTPDMISGMAYGTFIFFGVITLLGAGFIWLFVPETKRLTLEEMDILFGSAGIASADRERMHEIQVELGLLGASEPTDQKIEHSPDRTEEEMAVKTE